MRFGEALDIVIDNAGRKGMRLPAWKEDVVIKLFVPRKNSAMTAPFLYVDSRYGRVPWKETVIEMFAEDWEIVVTI